MNEQILTKDKALLEIPILNEQISSLKDSLINANLQLNESIS